MFIACPSRMTQLRTLPCPCSATAIISTDSTSRPGERRAYAPLACPKNKMPAITYPKAEALQPAMQPKHPQEPPSPPSHHQCCRHPGEGAHPKTRGRYHVYSPSLYATPPRPDRSPRLETQHTNTLVPKLSYQQAHLSHQPPFPPHQTAPSPPATVYRNPYRAQITQHSPSNPPLLRPPSSILT